MDRILVLNGPNLNLLGLRKQSIYGSVTLQQVVCDLVVAGEVLGCEVEARQSNHEGLLIDWVQQSPGHVDGIILNAGGLTHTSISLRDAVEYAAERGVPTVEIHVSDILRREPFRQHSYLTEVCIAQVVGKGPDGYLEALKILHRRLHPKN